MPYNIAIFASGSGSNAENISKYFADSDLACVKLVLVNRRNAGVFARMEPLGVKTLYVANDVWDNDPASIIALLRQHEIDLVALAGFMHYVATDILDAYPNRVLNIHPSLLPAYGGKGMWGHHVHEAVVAAGEKESGATVHRVTPVMDDGEIVMARKVAVLPTDTPATLEARVHEAEYILYPQAITLALRSL